MASMADKCRLCLGDHDSINVLSYLDGKTKLSAVLESITGILVRTVAVYLKPCNKFHVFTVS